jgi:hypothetical protein
MGIITIDGSRFIDGLSREHIVFEETRLDECIEYINSKEIKHVLVSMEHEVLNNINFVTKCPNIESLGITSPFIQDYSPVYSLKNLKSLSIDRSPIKIPGIRLSNAKLDLSQITSLEEFGAYTYKNIINLDKCMYLKRLSLTYYYPQIKNTEELSSLENLESLIIIKSNIGSFKGLGDLKKLHKIDLSYLSNLYHLDELDKISDNLLALRFDGCKRINNYEYVTKLRELQSLSFNNCGEILSIGFIRQMPKLKAFVFVGTNVLDGDISPCIGLDYVAFSNKRHYSHKESNFPRDNVSSEIKALLRPG